MKTRILSLLLSVLMLVSLVPVSVSAAEPVTIGGGILVDNTAKNGEAALYYEILNVPANSEVLVKLYAGENEIAYKKITREEASDALGCSFYTVGESSSWEQNDWTAYDNVIPTRAVVYINGVETAEDNKVEFTAQQWIDFPGTVASADNIYVVIYRNGNTEKAHKSVKLDDYYIGEAINLSALNIADYYTSANGYEFEGWYNDGGWNNYKAGNPNNKLTAINAGSWTNIICMVTDYENIVVKAVTNGDKDNAETIAATTALHGTELSEVLNTITFDEKTGYTLDKWYNWDWYGHKIADDATVNGWTNVYVTYTACEHPNTFNDILEANCSTEGHKKVICKDCGNTVSEETLPKNDVHFFYNGKCMKCGAAEEPCAHKNTTVDILEANCSAEGYKKIICKDCGNTVSEETLPKNDVHFFYNGKCMKCGQAEEPCAHKNTTVDILEANCSAEGYKKIICKDCGNTVSEETLPKNDVHFFYNGKCMKCGQAEACAHDYVVVKELAATCKEPGYVWMECSLCGAEKNHEVGEANGAHDYVVVKELAATCKEPGYVWMECSLCGAEKNHEVGEANGPHDYVVVKELAATCKEPGYVWMECSLCGAEKNHEVGEANGAHDYVVVKELAATCKEAGYVWMECSLCGAEKNHEVGEATGEHGETRLDIIEATCSKEGLKKVICKVCDTTVSEEILPKNDVHFFYNGKCMKCGAAEEPCTHENTTVDILEANCSAEGHKKVICKDCGNTVSEETLPKNDVHFFYNGKCMKCGQAEACAHDYVVVKELAATCKEPGYVWMECSLCGAEKNHEVGEANGAHDYVVVKELAATCKEPGYVWMECSLCGAEKNHEVGEANGAHDYVVVKELAATCKEPGYVWMECSLCGAEKNHEVGEANGAHDYVVVKELAATCKEPGYVWMECSLCGAEKNHEVGEATGEHVKTHIDMMDATCAKEGWKKVICDYCGTTVSEEILTKNDNHAFQNGVCTVCGAEDADYVATPTFDYVLLALAARYSQKFDVIVTAENATVTGDLSIKYKRSGTVDIAVADGYKLVDVIANGQSLGAVDSVTFKKVVAPQTLVVVTEALYTNPYTDIAADNAAVQYVTENGIMTAVEESKFAPEAEATRALIANVLYAVAGKPEFEATVTVNDSTDAAILWAASDGILTPDADGLVKADTVITMADLNAALNAYAGTTDVDYIGLDAEAAAVAATRADVANTIYLFCTIPAEW